MKHQFTLIGFVVAMTVLFGSYFCVGEGETAIVTRFGHIVSVAERPGFHLKWPLVDAILRFDRRYQALGTLTSRIQTAQSSEVNVEYSVIGQIADPQRFYRATGGDSRLAVAQLTPVLTDTLRDRLHAWTLHQLIADQSSSLTREQRTRLNGALNHLGIRVIDVRIVQVDFPSDSQQTAAVYQRMQTQRLQEGAALRADGEEQLIVLRAKADQEVAVLVANAERDAQRIQGQADAEVARIQTRAAAVNPPFYAYYRGLEAFRRAMSTGDAVIILRSDDAFLRGMNQDH